MGAIMTAHVHFCDQETQLTVLSGITYTEYNLRNKQRVMVGIGLSNKCSDLRL
jgi:hypothetical protein